MKQKHQTASASSEKMAKRRQNHDYLVQNMRTGRVDSKTCGGREWV
jgi:hypothetical protein